MSIKLPGEDDFSRRFNVVSDLFLKAHDTSLTLEERELAWDEYWSAKTRLEMGMEP